MSEADGVTKGMEEVVLGEDGQVTTPASLLALHVGYFFQCAGVLFQAEVCKDSAEFDVLELE